MLIATLIFFLLCSIFFSAAETSMMAVNRYRLRHLSRKSHVRATRVLRLLERPDRLLSVVLIGNTFCNTVTAAIATMLAIHAFGDMGALVATVILTLVILIFGETAPKTVAVMFSQRVALFVSWPLMMLLKVFYPLVWMVNGTANATLRLFGIHVKKGGHESLSLEELRTIVHEAVGKGSSHYQDMLLRVLDMRQMTVDAVMVPKHEIYGIDLTQAWDTILTTILQCTHAFFPLYQGDVNKTRGMVSMRAVILLLQDKKISNASELLANAEEVYFIPTGALLHQQVLNFQQKKKKTGLVVDEYGVIQGLLTLQDVLEEIVGDFDAGALEAEQHMSRQEDDSILVDGAMSVRDLNRLAGWHLPAQGPRTLSGLIVEYLESIPEAMVCVRISGYPMEVVSVSHNTIEQVRVWASSHDAKPRDNPA